MKIETLAISILLLIGLASAQSYIWDGEDQNIWDNQKLAAGNDIGEDSVTVNQVCEWLESNNPDGFENNCMVSPDLDWPEVSQIITRAQESDISDRWVKISKLITCVESGNPPLSLSECNSNQEISPVVALISEQVSADTQVDQEGSSNTDTNSDQDQTSDTDTTSENDQNLEEQLDNIESTIGDSDNEGVHDHAFGDIYFYDTENNEKVVRSDAENDYQDQKVRFDMGDGQIQGRFTWNNLNEVEHTLWVRNEDSEEDPVITTSSSSEITVPYSDTTFGADEDGNYQISDGCTKFNVAVLPPNWAGSEEDVTYDAEQMQEFEFCPFTNEERFQESDSYRFGITPGTSDITSETDVTLTATGTDFEDKRLKLEVNDVKGINNDPYSIRECSGTSCSVTVDGNRIERQPGEIAAKIERYDESVVLGNKWPVYEMVTWDVEK